MKMNKEEKKFWGWSTLFVVGIVGVAFGLASLIEWIARSIST